MGLFSYFKPSKAKAADLNEKTNTSDGDETINGIPTPSSMDEEVYDAFTALRYETLASYIHSCQQQYLWINSNLQTVFTHDQGVVLKMGCDKYTAYPHHLEDIPNGFYAAIKELNVRVSLSLRLCVALQQANNIKISRR